MLASLPHLVHLDDLAVRVVEEDLLPALHGPGAIVRERDALGLEARLEGVDVVGAEGDVAALDGVDRLPRAEAYPQVLLGEVELGGAVAQERDLAGVAVADAVRLQRRLRL